MRLLLLLAATCCFAANTLTIRDTSGSTQTDRAISFGRVFKQGEIAQFAQAVVGGTPVATQCDVKNRWQDGSLKFAIVSFQATVPASSSITVGFQNQATGNNTGMLDKAGALALTWDASIEATASSILKSADARTMLNAASSISTDIDANGARYWLRGPVVTQIIVEDRSSARAHDFGWTCASSCSGEYASASWTSDSTHRSLHPIFVLSFYAGTNAVKVDYILENAWTTHLQDQRYAVNVKTGSTSRYSATFPHYAKTRWRKAFWYGTAPGEISIDHNLPYLISTKAMPNYDTAMSISGSKISSDISAWSGLPASQKDINGNGWYQKYMPGTGQTTAEHIGIVPSWQLRYLYTMAGASANNYLTGPVLGNAEISSWVPVHLRESLTGRLFQDANDDGTADSVDAHGRWISINARPGIKGYDMAGSLPGDGYTPVATLSDSHGWTPELAHEPAFTYVPYLITGDWHFYEEMAAWGAFNFTETNYPPDMGWSRNMSWGVFNVAVQTRGQAWALRTLGQTAFAAPDDSADALYFRQKLANSAAVFEGRYNMTNGRHYQACTTNYDPNTEQSKWCWGNKTAAQSPFDDSVARWPTAVKFVGSSNANCHDYVVTLSGQYCDLPWHEGFLYSVFGHLAELGFSYDKIVEDRAGYYIERVLDPSFNPYLLDAYQISMQQANRSYYTTWSAVKAAYIDSIENKTSWDASGPSDYPMVAYSNLAYAKPYSSGAYSGADAWQWMQSNIYDISSSDDPKWAIIAREAEQPPDPPADGRRIRGRVRISGGAVIR